MIVREEKQIKMEPHTTKEGVKIEKGRESERGRAILRHLHMTSMPSTPLTLISLPIDLSSLSYTMPRLLYLLHPSLYLPTTTKKRTHFTQGENNNTSVLNFMYYSLSIVSYLCFFIV